MGLGTWDFPVLSAFYFLLLGFFGAVLAGHLVGVARYVDGASAAHAKLALRERNLYALFQEEFSDAVVDLTLNSRMATRLISPDHQAKVQRPVRELQKLNRRLGVFKHKLHAFGCAQK